ncbi:LPS export ABC transporter periplasmic protein LptC [Aphanothece hegewaldii]|uniref:LPS export ABC transporter periplasmic protein LptC n=1 Tax=Aphanothece hegewaldii TaxID=1521625 RepID=UPI001FE9B098|nr:LPS export ABC transporter periplasmic protein LptC [Aphanothece hegewaldii]
MLIHISACQSSNPVTEKDLEQPTKEELDSRLTLNNATLEQADAKGQTLWKIQVNKANYSKDKKVAQLEKVKGNLYQDGKVVLYVSANKGTIEDNGKKIFLRENITATDPRNGIVIRGDEVEWRPEDNILMIRNNLKGIHTKLQATAKEGRYHTKQERLELVGDILATVKEPPLQIKTNYLSWDVKNQFISGDQPINIVRFKDKTITDQLSAKKVIVSLKDGVATLQNEVQYKSFDPPIQIATNEISWNYKARLIGANTPVEIFQYKDKITVTGNRAHVDLNNKMTILSEGVQSINQSSPSKLYSNQLIWNMATQMVEASGNVIYEQAKPKMNFTGEKAVGIIKDNSLILNGNNNDRVVTEIYPEEKK